MKQLKVRKLNEKYRQYWIIDGRPIGLGNKVGNFKTKAEAVTEAEKLVSQFNLGLISKPQEIFTVLKASENFLAQEETRLNDGLISESNLSDKKRGLKYCLATKIDGFPFNKHKLNIIKVENKAEISAAFVRWIKAEGKSKATSEKRIKVLKQFFNFCVAKGWIPINPLDKVSFGLSTSVSDKAPFIQPETIQKLVSVGIKGESQRDQVAILLSLASGLRQGELRALSWQDVDFEEGEIYVRQAVKHGGLKIGDTKTKRGNRVIPIDDATLTALKLWKVKTRFSDDEHLVFPSRVGTPQKKHNFGKLIDRVCKVADIDLSWGYFRHFYASVQLAALGEDWGSVAELLGHSNPNFTYRQYGHYSKNKHRQDKTRNAAASAIYGG